MIRIFSNTRYINSKIKIYFFRKTIAINTNNIIRQIIAIKKNTSNFIKIKMFKNLTKFLNNLMTYFLDKNNTLKINKFYINNYS